MTVGRTSFAKENRLKIIKTVLDKKQVTKPQLVKLANISTSNVRDIIEKYLHYDILHEVGIEVSTGGRKAKLLGMNTTKNYILILNNMWNETKYFIYDSAGSLIEEGVLHIHRFNEDAIFNLISEKISIYKHFVAIGICAYGVVMDDYYLTGTTAKNWEKIFLGRNIESRFNIAVYMVNDLRAATYGASYLYDQEFLEHKRKNKNLVFLHLSTMGTGLGIMINGQLHDGFKNIAGETGFMPLLDTYADDLYVNKNLTKDQMCALTGRYTSIINYVINPEIIIISGNLFDQSMLESTIQYMEELSPFGFCPKLINAADSETLTTLGTYFCTRNMVIEDEVWFR